MKNILVNIFAGAIITISVMTIIGYLTQTVGFTLWIGSVPMAFNTAVAFLCTGLALAFLNHRL